MSATLLDRATVELLNAKVSSNGGKSSILATSVARLYVCQGGQWKYTGIFGIIAFIMDRESQVRYIRIYDSSKVTVRFQVEVSAEPGYTMESEFFHTLELDNEVIGFLFALGREQSLPEDKNKTLTSEAKRFGNAVIRQSSKNEDIIEARRLKQAIPGGDVSSSKRRPSAFVKISSALGLGFGKGNLTPQTASVSTPTDFKHVAHIGLNDDGTMDVNNVPEEWKDYLKAAGVKKKDFKNPEKAKIIVSTLGTLVVPASSGTKGSPVQKGPPKTMLVKFAHQGSTEKEVSVSPGEVVIQVKSYPDGWTRVKKMDGAIGMVPSTYLEETNGGNMPAVHTTANTTSAPAPAAAPVPFKKPDSPKNNATVTFEKKVAPPPPVLTPSAQQPVQRGSAPPPRPQPPRPAGSTATPPPRPSPPVPAQKAQPAKEVTIVEDHVDEEYAQEVAEEVATPAPALKPNLPRPNTALLAGIQGFNKEELAKSSDGDQDDSSSRPPANPLLASIKGFNKEALQKAESPVAARSSAPNPLDAIKSGNFQLKKVEKVEKPDEPPKPTVAPEVEGIAGLLKIKLASIRLGVKEDEDDDSDAGSDWD